MDYLSNLKNQLYQCLGQVLNSLLQDPVKVFFKLTFFILISLIVFFFKKNKDCQCIFAQTLAQGFLTKNLGKKLELSCKLYLRAVFADKIKIKKQRL